MAESLALGPEFRLLAACCRWPPSKARLVAVLAAAAAPLDWGELSSLGARHRVEGLLHNGLTGAGVEPPAEVAADLRRRAAGVARRSLELAAESVRLQRAFEAAGVRVMVLKGAAVEQLAYGALGLKSAWDIDLLVSPGDVEEARAVLGEAEYDLVEKDGLTAGRLPTWVALAKECEFARRDGVVVELHWRLVDGAALLPGLSVASGAQRVELSRGAWLTTLNEEALFSYLCVHGALHGWSRLKWLSDLAALLARRTPDEIERLYRASIAQGAGLCSAQALRLCERIFETGLGAGLSAELLADGQARWLERSAWRTLTGGGAAEVEARPLEASRILLSHFMLARGWRYRLGVLRQRWVGVDDRINIPLPRPLRFLYHFMRPPLWLWRRIRGLI